MLKVNKSNIMKGRVLSFESDSTFPGYELTYPILGIKECHYEADLEKIGEYKNVTFSIKATLTLSDSRDGVAFDKIVKVNESVDILDVEDDTGEGFVISGNYVDLDDLCIRVLHASLPIRVTRPDAKVSGSGKNYVVMTEDEYNAQLEKENEYNPAFDALKDLELDE